MTFDDVLSQVLGLLQCQGRVSYRSLKRRFDLDDAYIEDLKEELIHALHVATDEDDRVLVATGIIKDATSEAQAVDEPAARSMVPPDRPVQHRSQTETLPIPEAERRHLTVMFCDLIDSTDLSARLDPEDLRDVVRAYQEGAAEIIEHYGGYIAQYLGDGLLVYFAYPVAHEDDARRAVHTGLGLIEMIQALNVRLQAEYRVELAVRVGIHTGPVVIGEMGGGGRHERLALGETPNIAARLERLAESNTVLISAAITHLVQQTFAFEPFGLHELRGIHAPMPVARVLYALDEGLGVDEANRQRFARLVGRQAEVDFLLGRWQAIQKGQGQVVWLRGEAGIGKSSLLHHLRGRLRQAGVTTVTLRCSPYTQNSDLYPFIAHAQRVAGWERHDTPESKLDKLEQMLRRSKQPLEKTVPLFARLLSFQLPPGRYPEPSLTPQALRQQIVETLVALTLEEAACHPLLFVWEDLHWADPSTLGIIGMLLEQTPAVPMLTILAYRPEFVPPWPSAPHIASLTLPRLERDEVAFCIAQLTNKVLPAEVVQHVIDKTDGIPLYIEEFTRMLLASHFLAEGEEGYVLTGQLAEAEIPATLQGSLMARLDQLQSAKEVAQHGAVLGREFSYEMLQAMVDMDQVTLHTHVSRLVDAGLLCERRSAPMATYLFRHALIRDAAYESLLRRTRQQIHQRAAQLMESRFADTIETQPELLAYHYTEAGRVEPALVYWQRAGERALQRSAHAEAISHLHAGLRLLATQPPTPEHRHRELQLQTTLGTALIATKGYSAPEVEQAYTRARELCQQAEETPLLIRSLYGLFSFYTVRAELDIAYGFAKQLFSVVERETDSEFLIEAHRAVGTTSFYHSQFVDAQQHLEQVRTIYQPLQHRSHAFLFGQDPGMAGHAFLGLTRWLLGYPHQALQFANQAVAVAQESKHVFSSAYALNFLVWCHHLRRDIASVATQSEALVALSIEQGFILFQTFGTFLRGWALAQQGQREAGLDAMSQGLADLQRMHQLLWQPYCVGLLAEAYSRDHHQADRALGMIDDALATLERTGESWYTVELHRLKGEVLLRLHTDRRCEAEAVFQQALVLARQQQARSWELRTAVSLGKLWRQQGKGEQARTLLAPIYDGFMEGLETYDLQQAKALLQQLAS